MEFITDLYSVKYSHIVIEYTEKRSIEILKPNLEDFKNLFKFFIYSEFKERIDELNKLLVYARTHLSAKLKFPSFLAEPWFKNDNAHDYSALEMVYDQEKVLELFASHIKEAKKTDPSINFVETMISMIKHKPNAKGFASLIACHSPKELSTSYRINYESSITLLMQAIIYENNIEQLLDAGCNPNGKAYPNPKIYEDNTPINVVLELPSPKEKKKLLIDALRKAAKKQEACDPLLFCHEVSNRYLTPLMRAACAKNTEAIELLLDYPEVRNSINTKEQVSKMSALAQAVLLKETADTAREEKAKAIIKILLAHGASANCQDMNQCNPLMIAATSGPTLAVFEFLLDSLYKKESQQELTKLLNQQQISGFTILNCLLSRKKTDGVKAMIEKIIAYGGQDLTIFFFAISKWTYRLRLCRRNP